MHGWQAQDPPSILNIGLATADCVRLFQGAPCRLYFADVFDEIGAPGDASPGAALPGNGAALLRSAESFFARNADAHYDFLLLWDFCNYLAAAELRRFGELLRRHLAPGACAHAFAAFNSMAEFVGLRFDLRRPDELAITDICGAAPHCHIRKGMDNLLWPLRVNRAVLLGGNRQELLLRAPRQLP